MRFTKPLLVLTILSLSFVAFAMDEPADVLLELPQNNKRRDYGSNNTRDEVSFWFIPKFHAEKFIGKGAQEVDALIDSSDLLFDKKEPLKLLRESIKNNATHESTDVIMYVDTYRVYLTCTSEKATELSNSLYAAKANNLLDDIRRYELRDYNYTQQKARIKNIKILQSLAKCGGYYCLYFTVLAIPIWLMIEKQCHF